MIKCTFDVEKETINLDDLVVKTINPQSIIAYVLIGANPYGREGMVLFSLSYIMKSRYILGMSFLISQALCYSWNAYRKQSRFLMHLQMHPDVVGKIGNASPLLQ